MDERVRYESAERVRDFYRQQGAATEKERILEILEAFDWLTSDGQRVIALIKGETK